MAETAFLTTEKDKATDARLSKALAEVDLTPSDHCLSMPPTWRWQRAALLLDSERTPGRREDTAIREAVKLLLAKRQCQTSADLLKLRHRFPGTYQAWRIYVSSTLNKRWSIEAYLCASAPLEHIAARAQEHVETIWNYARLFFDVMGKQKHRLYMLNEVIGRSVHYGLTDRDYDLLWKLFGLLQGPAFLDRFIGHDDPAATLSSAVHNMVKVQNEDQAVVASRTGLIDYNREVILATYQKALELEQAAGNDSSTAPLIQNNIRQMICSFGFEVAADTAALPTYLENGVELRVGGLLDRVIETHAGARASTLQFPPERAKPAG